MISIIIPLGKEDSRYINSCLNSIPKNIFVYLIDDSPSHYYLNNNLFNRENYIYKEFDQPSDFYRAADAIKSVENNLPEETEIVGIVDEDTDFNVLLDDKIEAEHIVPVGGFFNKVERLLTVYKNLVVFGMRIDTDFDRTFAKQRYTHPDIIWSTETTINHAWQLMHADGNVFIRNDFLKEIGGFPTGTGYGEEKPDLCRRAIKSGGVIGVFRDLPYYHNMHGDKLWRVSTELPCDPNVYRFNELSLVR